MAQKNIIKIYRAEYYEPKIGRWVSFYESSEIEKCRSYLDLPIVGNPDKRLAEYEKSGIRKIKYQFVKTIEQKFSENI